MMDTSDAWIRERTGICTRQIITDETLEDLAAEAAQKALDNAGIPAGELDGDGLWIVKLIVSAGMCKSNGEARRLLQGNAVKINGEKVSDMNLMLKAADCPEKELLLQTGKKNFKKVIFA
jgi:tyrosyl-tRNA synthetase